MGGGQFETAGYTINGKVYTSKIVPINENICPLSSIVEMNIRDNHYYLDNKKIEKYRYLRGSKKILRKRSDGTKYYYSEGAMSSFDSLDLPGRTMLTSEGTTNRSTHIICDLTTNELRLLTPIECERLNQFPDNWTNTGMPEKRRYFMMGNALVVGVIKRIAKELETIIEEE